MCCSRGLKEKIKKIRKKKERERGNRKEEGNGKEGLDSFRKKISIFFLNGKKLVCFCAHIYNEKNEKSEGGTG